jgi:hypothetical protein
MNNIATLTAQPQSLVVDGKEYKVYPLTFADLGELQTWIDSQFPDPFEVVSKAMKSGNFNYAQQQYMLSQAIEKATRPKHLLGTPEADELLMSMEGAKKTLTLSIRRGNPAFTDEEADKLFSKLTEADVAKIAVATNLDMVVTDPKEQSLNVLPPPRPNGSATSRKQRRASRRGTGGNSSMK